MHADVLRLQALQRFDGHVFPLVVGESLEIVGEFALWNHLHLVAGVADFQRGLVAVDHKAGALRVDGAAADGEEQAAGELGGQLDVFGHVAFRSARRQAVGVNAPGADAGDARREFRLAGGEHERVQAVRHEVTEQAAAVWVILAPAMEGVCVERAAGDRTEPLRPVDGFRRGFLLDGVVPFALLLVAAVIALGPDQLANLSGLNELGRFVPGAGGAALRSDLENATSLLHRVVNSERLVQVARHRLLAIDVLAGFHRVDGHGHVIRVVRGDHDGINVFSLEQLPVVGVNVGFLERFGHLAGVLLGVAHDPGAALRVHVARGGHEGVVLLAVLLDAHDVVLADAVTDADDGDGDAVIGADHSAGGGRGALAIDGRLDDAGRSDGRGGSGGLLDEAPAGVAAGRWFAVCIVHNKARYLFVSVLLAGKGAE